MFKFSQKFCLLFDNCGHIGLTEAITSDLTNKLVLLFFICALSSLSYAIIGIIFSFELPRGSSDLPPRPPDQSALGNEMKYN